MTIYPTVKLYNGVTVQREVLTSKYIIWNASGECRASRGDLAFDNPPDEEEPEK